MSKTDSFDGKPRSLLSVLIHAYHPRTWRERGILYAVGVLLATYLIIVGVLWLIWDSKPSLFEPREIALAMAGGDEKKLVAGYVTTATVIHTAETLLDKPGGYLSNDRFPPGVLTAEVDAPLFDFMLERLRNLLRDAGHAPAAVDAVLALRPTRIDLVVPKLEAVAAFQQLPENPPVASGDQRKQDFFHGVGRCSFFSEMVSAVRCPAYGQPSTRQALTMRVMLE